MRCAVTDAFSRATTYAGARGQATAVSGVYVRKQRKPVQVDCRDKLMWQRIIAVQIFMRLTSKGVIIILGCIAYVGASLICARPAIAQERIVVADLTPLILDRWLIFYANILGPIKAAAAKGEELAPSDSAKLYEIQCPKAGFISVQQCNDVDRYIVALISGMDEESGWFIDPHTLARRQLAIVEANKAMTEQDRRAELDELAAFIAALPDSIPSTHVDLMNNNREKIIKLIMPKNQ